MMAERACELLPEEYSAYDVIHAVNDSLFQESGLRGNSDDYYDPRNSYLNEVIDRGLGIPITLSIIYMHVARGTGKDFHGIGMPGHFLVRAGHGLAEIFIDPYRNGGLLSRKECLDLAQKNTNGISSERPDVAARRLLPECSNNLIIRRLLTNLKLTLARRRDYAAALRASERLQLLNPSGWRNLSDLARLQAEVGQYDRAVASLTKYLECAPEGADTSKAEGALRQLRALTSRLGASNAESGA